MLKRDLFKLACGTYLLTDNHNLYKYELEVGLNQDQSRFYLIKPEGSISRSNIFMLEEMISEDYKGIEIQYKTLTAIVAIGGIHVHSDDTYSILRDLSFIPRGSFKQFIANCISN